MSACVTPEVGQYLAGLTDGEGCFGIYTSTRWTYRVEFVINLRADDRPLLEWLKAETGLGYISVASRKKRGDKPTARWAVQSIRECLDLIAIFETYPLRSKKARDFEIWAKAVRTCSAGGSSRIGRFMIALRAMRSYEGSLAASDLDDEDEAEQLLLLGHPETSA